jgi:uncharacterized protein (TIGR00251 family)
VKPDPAKVGKAVLEGGKGMGSVIMDIEVTPSSGMSGVAGFDEWRGRLMVKVRAPPEKGKANKEVIEVVARFLGIPDSHVELDKGATSHKKRVIVMGLKRDEVIARIMEGLK